MRRARGFFFAVGILGSVAAGGALAHRALPSSDRFGATSTSDAVRIARQDPALSTVNGVWFHHGTRWTGIITDRDPATGERTETPVRNGRVDGVVRAWFANGRPMSTRPFTEGRESGVHEGWYPDGRLRFRSRYADGVLEGQALEWYPDGTPYRDFTYRAGHEEGRQRMWYANGTLRANYVMRDGRRFGLPGTKGCTGSDTTMTASVASSPSAARTRS